VRQAEGARAVMAFLFDIVFFGQWRQSCSIAAKLTRMIDDDFRAALVFGHFPMYFYTSALQLPHIPDVL